MFLGSTNLVISYFALKGRFQKVFRDEEFRTYLLTLAGLTTITALVIYFESDFVAALDGDVWQSMEAAFRYGLFQVISIVSTTGFITADYTMWTPFLVILFFGMMFLRSEERRVGKECRYW